MKGCSTKSLKNLWFGRGSSGFMQEDDIKGFIYAVNNITIIGKADLRRCDCKNSV